MVETNQRKEQMYKKIDIMMLNRTLGIWEYFRSTNQSKTCKEAKVNVLRAYPYLSEDQIKCWFSKDNK